MLASILGDKGLSAAITGKALPGRRSGSTARQRTGLLRAKAPLTLHIGETSLTIPFLLESAKGLIATITGPLVAFKALIGRRRNALHGRSSGRIWSISKQRATSSSRFSATVMLSREKMIDIYSR